MNCREKKNFPSINLPDGALFGKAKVVCEKKTLFNWTRAENRFIIIKCGSTLNWHEILIAKLFIELIKSYNSMLVVFPVFHQSQGIIYGRYLTISLKLPILVHSHVARYLIIWKSEQCSSKDYLSPRTCTLCYKMVLGLNTWFRYKNCIFFILYM